LAKERGGAIMADQKRGGTVKAEAIKAEWMA